MSNTDEPKKLQTLTHNCLQCRQARTRCDRTSPCCRRCTRKQLICTGGMGEAPRRGRPRGKVPTNHGSKKRALVVVANGVDGDKKQRRFRNLPTRVHVKESEGVGMTPCRQMQFAILSVVADASWVKGGKKSAWKTTDHSLLHKAIVSHVLQWTWIALMRKTLYLLGEVASLCTACRLPFQFVDDVFQAHYRSADPPIWQTLSPETCLTYIPVNNLMAWQNDEGFLLVYCTYYGRRFYISSNKMKIFMSAARANDLWADNQRNVISCFFEEESTAKITKTESVLITHPSSQIKYQFCNQTEETIAAVENGLNVSNSSVSSLVSSSGSDGSDAAPSRTNTLLQDTLLSSGMTEHVIQVMDTHKNHYMCSVNITLYTSVCGKFRTQKIRLLPVNVHPVSSSSSSSSSSSASSSSSSSLSSSSSSSSSQVSLDRATAFASDAVTFCCDHGFQQVAENNNLFTYDDNDLDFNSTSFDDGQFSQTASSPRSGSSGHATTSKAVVTNENSIDALWDIFAEQIAAQTSGSSGDTANETTIARKT